MRIAVGNGRREVRGEGWRTRGGRRRVGEEREDEWGRKEALMNHELIT
jgi:hypothetical protein